MTGIVSPRGAFVPHDVRHGAAEQAMRRHGMMIGLVCENMLAGRPGLSGLGQFLDGSNSNTPRGGPAPSAFGPTPGPVREGEAGHGFKGDE